MTEPVLKDPRKMYHSGKFSKQDQDTPALEEEMAIQPDCGEESYQGNHRLENRRVLITGADSGIGRAVAIAFAREGADIALHFLPGEEKDANEVADYIKKAGRKVSLLSYDLREDDSPQKIIKQAVEELGGLDTLVLNAAQQFARESISELEIQQVRDTFTVNIISIDRKSVV